MNAAQRPTGSDLLTRRPIRRDLDARFTPRSVSYTICIIHSTVHRPHVQFGPPSFYSCIRGISQAWDRAVGSFVARVPRDLWKLNGSLSWKQPGKRPALPVIVTLMHLHKGDVELHSVADAMLCAKDDGWDDETHHEHPQDIGHPTKSDCSA